MIGRHLVLICAVLTCTAAQVQAQSATLRQERILEGDIAELTVEHDAEIPSLYAIDTSALEQDFRVLGVKPSVSRHTNGDESFHRMQWKIEMVPRHPGSIAIPSLAFGPNHSESVLLRVENTPATLRKRENVFIEVETFPADPHSGQQIRVTTRLLHNLPLVSGRLSEPESEQVSVFRSGKDARYSVLRNGENFEVLERSVLMVAPSSGSLAVSAASFNGVIDSLALDGMRFIFREGRDLSLEIRAKPPGYENIPWLPARQLELALEWDDPADVLQPGDSLGFTLNMEASGLPAESLPVDLLAGETARYRIYADEAQLETSVIGEFDGEQLIGKLRQRFVIIAQAPGKIVIPSLALSWWDTVNSVERIATTDPRTLQIVDSMGPGGAGFDSTGSTRSQVMLLDYLQRNWRSLASVFVVLVLLVLIARVTQARARIGEMFARAAMRRRSRDKLLRACRANDAAAARQALIDWGRVHWKDDRISGLHHVQGKFEPGDDAREFAAELACLDNALYAENAASWHGERLWKLIDTKRRNAGGENPRRDPEILPPPYPPRN